MTYDFLCFSDLVYEFDQDNSFQTEKKIRRRLKYYKLEPYKQERVDYIRQLKNELYSEINKNSKSIYFTKAHGRYAQPDDYNFELLKNDYLKKYSHIDEIDMVAIINLAIYLYYLR